MKIRTFSSFNLTLRTEEVCHLQHPRGLERLFLWNRCSTICILFFVSWILSCFYLQKSDPPDLQGRLFSALVSLCSLPPEGITECSAGVVLKPTLQAGKLRHSETPAALPTPRSGLNHRQAFPTSSQSCRQCQTTQLSWCPSDVRCATLARARSRHASGYLPQLAHWAGKPQ